TQVDLEYAAQLIRLFPPSTTGGVVSDAGGSSLHYYVQFTLKDGSFVTVNDDTLFALDDFSLGEELDAGSASGTGSGKVTFNPAHLSLQQPELNPELLQLLAKGTALKQVDILGYDATNNNQLAVDYTLKVAVPEKVSIDQSGVTQLDLGYAAQVIEVPSSGSPLPTTGVSPSVDTSSQQYYVQFTLADDHKVTVDGSQLFALDGFSFSDAIIPNIGGASGGAGAGKVTLNPLHLSFEQPGLDPILFQSLAAGTALQQVDIFG